MVKYLADTDGKRGIFLCDGCGKPLYGEDSGEVYFPDYEKFLEDVEKGGGDHTQVHFLCKACYARVKEKDGEQEDEQE